MKRRTFLSFGAAGMGVLAMNPVLVSVPSFSKPSRSRPNILLIMADDMGFSDIGCYGGEIQTPNIDKLAAGGLRFSQFYNAARCCPTRASLLTSLYPHQAGMGDMVKAGDSEPGQYQGYLNDRCVTVAEVLRDAGYATLMSGKWHVGERRPYWPTDRGFQNYFGLISGAANYFDITRDRTGRAKRQMAFNDQPYSPPKEGFYMTDAVTDRAIEFLGTHGSGKKPFFLYVAYTAPHWPLHALPEDIEKYRGKYMKGWDALRNERYERQLSAGLIDRRWAISPRDEEITAWNDVPNKEAMDIKMAVYAAQIDRMDQGIGRILAKVESLGETENTLVFFLSDNGGCHEGGPWGFDDRNNGLSPGSVDSYMSYGRSWANASNTPFRLFKHWVHEGGIATPLVVYWPGIVKRPGSITHQVGHIVDVMATVCEAAGATYPKTFQGKDILPMEGKSLVPIIQGGERKAHPTLFWEHEGSRAVRQGKWKLVSMVQGEWELFDLEVDRTELHNLVGQYPDKAQKLEKLYRDWATRWGVKEVKPVKG